MKWKENNYRNYWLRESLHISIGKKIFPLAFFKGKSIMTGIRREVRF
jgi:hypothetical protein